MSFSTNVPAIQWTPTGPIAPTETDILAGVQADQNAAFGKPLDPGLSTPQGQLATSETAIIGDKNNQMLMVANQVDPAYASGRWQDAIGRIYFLTRNPATSTVVDCTCIGLNGTVIPQGALAQDTSGNVYAAVSGGIIPIGGSITLEFAAVLTGPNPCPANTLTTIYKTIPGWDTINNPADGALGSNVESRNDFEFRRQQSVAKNGTGSAPSIYGNVFEVPGVLDCYVIDNPANGTVNKGSTNYPVLAHSVYVAVVGGDDLAVATAIWQKKDGGCNYNGNTTVTVTDTSGYNTPYPTYAITYERPAASTVYFVVNIKSDTNLPLDIDTQIKNAIANAFVGGDGGSRARIGSYISGSRYIGPIVKLSPYVIVESLFVGLTPGPSTTFVLMGIDQAPVTDVSHIVVNHV